MTFKFYASSDEVATAYRNGSIDSAYGIPEAGAKTAPYSRVFGVFFNQSAEQGACAAAGRKGSLACH
jgi:hypothetical protein